MKTNKFLFLMVLFAVSMLYAACKNCSEQQEDAAEYGASFGILDKTTRKNLLDYDAGSWVDSLKVKDLKTKKIVGFAPTPEGSMHFTYYDAQVDSESFNTTLQKKFMLNMRYSRDTFAVFFKMKHGNCRDELESMEVKYNGTTYNVDIAGHSFRLLK